MVNINYGNIYFNYCSIISNDDIIYFVFAFICFISLVFREIFNTKFVKNCHILIDVAHRKFFIPSSTIFRTSQAGIEVFMVNRSFLFLLVGIKFI